MKRAFALLVLLASPFAQADQVQVLDKGDQSLSAFYLSILNAKKSIDVATFIFEPCESAPKLLLDALVKKAKAGVKVRLLIDAYNLKQPTKASLPAYLATIPNFQVRLFNDAYTLATANNRSHIKAFVVDGTLEERMYIVGGRNMSDDYFGLSGKMNYIDQDVIVRGASAATAQTQYNALWNASWNAPTRGGNPETFVQGCLKPNARDLEVAKFISGKGKGILASRTVRSCGNVYFAMDDAGFMCGQDCNTPTESDDPLLGEGLTRKRMTGLFLDFVAATDSNIKIANQYFMPYIGRESRLFERLRGEGKSVQVYANSTGDIEVASRNKAFTCYMQEEAKIHSKSTQKVSMLSSWGEMNSHWELSVQQAKWRIHTKTAIRDDRDVLVSSFNIDPRSYNANLESGVVIEGCAGLASDVAAQYQELQKFTEADRSCRSCRDEILPENQTGSDDHCGGTPLFY